MKSRITFLFGFMVAVVSTATWAVTVKPAVKKASAVSTQTQTSGLGDSASLMGAVLGVVANVQSLNQQQKALTADCVPKTDEITFVNNIVKEWAKTGAMSADEVRVKLGYGPCSGGQTYANVIQLYGVKEEGVLCFDAYNGTNDQGTIWYNYPKASVTKYCSNGDASCKGKEKTVSNLYDIFNLVDFSTEDYATKQEITMAGKILDKVENCSNAKLSAKKRALWGSFLTNTLSSAGQKTNTADIMSQVQGLTQGGGNLLQGLGSVGSYVSGGLLK